MTGTQLISVLLVIGGGLIWVAEERIAERVPAQNGA